MQAAKATQPTVVRWMAAGFGGAGKRMAVEEIERMIMVEGKRGHWLGVKVRVF